jgi:hypothetical protein
MNKPCHRRIVSSSSNKAPATFSQLQPESKSTSALARRANRCAADPSRARAGQVGAVNGRQKAGANHAPMTNPKIAPWQAVFRTIVESGVYQN